MKTIGAKIATLRKTKRFSQEELADKLGIGYRTLGQIESGETKKVDFMLMDKICKEFGVGFEHFIEDGQVNKVKENKGGVVGNNHGTINNCPDNIVEQVKNLVEENALLKTENADLKKQLT